ncbi:putative manganese transporter [Cellulosilyticum sp. ST5]|uniref:putative manganese transporter n=1 Tax=Cellulosilyticum sp. ST5 TaxID=3055805 RepID=UPI003977D0D2
MELIIDALLDSIKLLPFLFLVYLLIGYLDSSTDNRLYRRLVGAKWLGPIIGSTLGCLPQCGFSVVGANLYSRGMISIGTLLAIFISTSDEAIPILFAHPGMLKSVGIVLGLKFIIAIFMGLVIEAIMRMLGRPTLTPKQMVSENMEVQGGCKCQDGCHSHNDGIWRSALLHTVKVFMYILVINLILNAIIEGIGEDSLSQILLSNSMWQPVLAALVGLIPNCAASIVLTEMYIAGTLSLGSLIAGLIPGAGMGLVILFKANKSFIENIKILGILYVTGVIFGMLLQMIS